MQGSPAVSDIPSKQCLLHCCKCQLHCYDPNEHLISCDRSQLQYRFVSAAIILSAKKNETCKIASAYAGPFLLAHLRSFQRPLKTAKMCKQKWTSVRTCNFTCLILLG